MTEEPTTGRPDPGADPLDELATAIVDGTATADEQARADEPALAERVAAHRRVVALVAEWPPLPGSPRRDQAIAAALAAADEDDGATAEGSDPPVAVLAARAGPARGRGAASRRWLTAAAVVAALAVAIPVLSNIDGAGDDGEQAATAPEASRENDDESTGAADNSADSPLVEEDGDTQAADEEAEGETASGSEPASPPGDVASPATTVVDLGTFADIEALLAAAGPALRAGEPAEVTTTSAAGGGGTGATPAGQVARCARRAAGDEPDTDVDGGATARLADRAVVVLLIDPATAPRLVVLSADDCDVLADRPL